MVLAALLAVPATAWAAAPTPTVWSVQVVAEGSVPAAELEKAAGGFRAGLRAMGKVVAPEGKPAEAKIVAHLSESADEFALRVDAPAPGEQGVAVTGPRVLLEDGAKKATSRLVLPTGRIAIPPSVHAEWRIDGAKVAPEGGVALVVPKGRHVVRATAGGAMALAVVDVFGGETTPFPPAALLALHGAAGTAVARNEPVNAAGPDGGDESAAAAAGGAHHLSKWVWIGGGAVAVLAVGAAAVAASGGGGTTTTTVQDPGTSTFNLTH